MHETDRLKPGEGPRFGRLVMLLMVVQAGVPSARAQIVFPGATWEFRTPAQLGMDGAKLDQVATIIGGQGCIVRDGYMVKTWGSQSSKVNWASASKPVITTMLFFAIHEGLIPGVDALVKDYGWTLIAKDQTMTFRHMADMTGTYTLADANGAVWAYSDYNIQLYQRTLFNNPLVFNQSADAAALSANRLGALQFEDGSIFNSAARMVTSVRDFSRIGWFWLNKGNWNGVQRLPQSYFNSYMKPDVPGSLPRTSGVAGPGGDYLGIGTYGGGTNQTPYGPGIYGFNWWFNATGGLHPASKTWPDAPDDTFQANGHWGAEVCTIMPGRRLVMSYLRSTALDSFTPGTNSTTNQVLKLLAESVPADTPVIALNKSQLNRAVHAGENLTDDSFTVTNTGAGTLEYLVQDNQTWLSEAPATGDSGGEADTITVSYAVSQLAVGTHQAMIQVLDNGSVPAAANSPQQIAVTVVVKTVLPDFDQDRDVDMSDFAFFQACFTPLGQTVGPACAPADLNADTQVNAGDLDLFLGCMSGADVPASKTCDDAFE